MHTDAFEMILQASSQMIYVQVQTLQLLKKQGNTDLIKVLLYVTTALRLIKTGPDILLPFSCITNKNKNVLLNMQV